MVGGAPSSERDPVVVGALAVDDHVPEVVEGRPSAKPIVRQISSGSGSVAITNE